MSSRNGGSFRSALQQQAADAHDPGLPIGRTGALHRDVRACYTEDITDLLHRSSPGNDGERAIHFLPHRMVAAGMRRERRTMADRFGANGLRRLQDIGGSAAFHALSPDERRRIAGFPEPYAYLVENCRRRAGVGDRCGPVFPDHDWRWLAMIEPELNIPLRSVFMLEFAVERARVLGASEISLFVGEIHNSDMVWLAGFASPRWTRRYGTWWTMSAGALSSLRGRRGALPGSASFWLRWRARPSRYRCTSASERGCGHEADRKSAASMKAKGASYDAPFGGMLPCVGQHERGQRTSVPNQPTEGFSCIPCFLVFNEPGKCDTASNLFPWMRRRRR